MSPKAKKRVIQRNRRILRLRRQLGAAAPAYLLDSARHAGHGPALQFGEGRS